MVCILHSRLVNVHWRKQSFHSDFNINQKLSNKANGHARRELSQSRRNELLRKFHRWNRMDYSCLSFVSPSLWWVILYFSYKSETSSPPPLKCDDSELSPLGMLGQLSLHWIESHLFCIIRIFRIKYPVSAIFSSSFSIQKKTET